MDLLTPTDHSTHCPHKGDARYWSVAAGGQRAENAVWAYDAPPPHIAGLRGHVAFYWGEMDRWLEEDEEVFVHARDPRKRVDITMSGREVEVVLGGETVARSTGAMFLFETDLPTRYYLPDRRCPHGRADAKRQPYAVPLQGRGGLLERHHRRPELGGHCLELSGAGGRIGPHPRPPVFLQ